MARKKKFRPVEVTNPPASRLPRGLGDYNPNVAPVEPVRPKLPPKHRQFTGPSVKVTNKRPGEVRDPRFK